MIETERPTDWKAERRIVGTFLRENVPGCAVLVVLFAFVVGIGALFL